ncbi:MAG: outer membrane lipid asymmetry maintenance protein MlaD [Rhodospirillaceae bacterium]
MTPRRETLIGAGVLGALALALALNAAGTGRESASSDSYDLRAVFQRTDGLIVGAQVRLAGLPVGRVVEQTLDDRYRAHVSLRINGQYLLPEDSSAIIETDGLLGGKYIELQPGADEDMLPPGGVIEYTQDSVVIEDILARIVAQAKARRVGADAEAEDAGDSLVPSLLGDDEKGG